MSDGRPARLPRVVRTISHGGVAVVAAGGLGLAALRDGQPDCHVSIPVPCISPDVGVAGSATYVQPFEGHVDPLPHGPVMPDGWTISFSHDE